MKSIVKVLLIFCPIIPGNDNSSAGGQGNEKVNDQVGDLTGGASHCRQSFGPYKAAYDYGVCRIIKLLKKGSQHNGKEKDQQLFPYNPFRDLIYGGVFLWHGNNPPCI